MGHRPPDLPEDHHCAWREHAERLETKLDAVLERVAVLERHAFGRRSEKMPPVAEALRVGAPPDPARGLERRRRHAKVRAELPARTIKHSVPEANRVCPACGDRDLQKLGSGKVTTMFELVPSRFEQQIHIQETLSCRCGGGVVTAEPPAKVFDKSKYGPAFIAHLVSAKCADSTPFYRLAAMYQRMGIPMGRSTMIELFHRAADLLAPLPRRLLELIACDRVVGADETPVRVQAPGKCRLGYLWTFHAGNLVAYRFSASRSGQTPAAVLGNGKGELVVDGYTGYNHVTTPGGRARVGCWAHVRRKFFDAIPTAPRAQEMVDLILELYRVEHAAKEDAIAGTDAHRALRQRDSRKVLARISAWLDAAAEQHPPRGALGKAITYARRQWPHLIRFVDDAELPLDNNASERALRKAALGRKNFLFVGSDQAGENLAGLYSLVATCEANQVNPYEYLADVLVRIQTHPQSGLDDLLPHRWKTLVGATDFEPGDRADRIPADSS
jgi:transposase